MTTITRLTTFMYLSQLIDLPVVDADLNRIGLIDDIIADIRGMYPRINALIVRKGLTRRKMLYSWSCVREIAEDRHIIIGEPSPETDPSRLTDHEIRLRETFWDKQIVDISGSKVVRVNDLHILRDGIKLWLVHADVGFKGLLRRLGWLRFFSSAINWLFSYEMKDSFIPWKYVQPVTSLGEFRSLALKIPHSKLSELHPADLADILIDLGAEERMLIFNSFDAETAADILQELPLNMRLHIAESLDHEKLALLVDEMPMDEVVDLLDEIHPETMASLFRLLPEEKITQIKTLLKHPDRSAGSLMNTEFVAAMPDETVGTVMKRIKRTAEDIESINYIYVLDGTGVPLGVLTIKELLLAGSRAVTGEIMRENVVRVKLTSHIKTVAQIFYKYNFTVVPVVDQYERMQGIITMKDAFEAVFPEIREETEEN